MEKIDIIGLIGLIIILISLGLFFYDTSIGMRMRIFPLKSYPAYSFLFGLLFCSIWAFKDKGVILDSESG